MKTVIAKVPRSTIRKFAEEHDLTMEINERDPGTLAWIGRAGHGKPSDRYWANFKNADVKDGSVLIGAFGNGPTPMAAIADYAREISGKKLVIDAGLPTRRELDVPVLTDKVPSEGGV